MTKTKGFKLRIDAFLPIDKKDFTKQAAAYATLAEIKNTGKLPVGFLDHVTILGVDAKEGSAELPDAPFQGDTTETIPSTEEPATDQTVLEVDEAKGRRAKVE